MRVSFFLVLLVFVAEISTAQPVFHSFPRTSYAQSCLHVKKSLASLTSGNEKENYPSWKSLIVPKRVSFTVCQPQICRRWFLIRAVATLEPKRVVHDGKGDVSMGGGAEFKNSQMGAAPSTSDVQLSSSSEDTEEMDARERLRRERISKANKGNTPWNKGRKHSAGNTPTFHLYTLRIYRFLLISKSFAETLRRIKERTRLAMQNPKVKSCKNGFMYSCGYKNGDTHSCGMNDHNVL